MQGRRTLPLLSAWVGAALCTLPSAQCGRGDEPNLPEPEVARLVRDLGSTNFGVREAATRRLLEWDSPPAALQAALKSGDAEVARRASRIVTEITRREEKAAFAKLTEFARRGEIDRLADLFGRRPKWEDEDACWQAVEDLAVRLVGLEREKYGCSFIGPARPPVAGLYRHCAQMARDRSVSVRTLFRGAIVRAERISQKGAAHALLVSSRDTKVADGLVGSLVLAGGPVEVGGMMQATIVVCDGGFRSRSFATGSLIIARGDVEFSGHVATGCRVITAGSVRFAPGIKRRNVEVHEHEPNPLGFIKWFDPASVGVTVEAASGGVRVKSAGKSFAAAGLRAGDLLSTIDGEAVQSPDDFRLLLRAKPADGGKIALAVRRAGRDLKIPVRCKD